MLPTRVLLSIATYSSTEDNRDKERLRPSSTNSTQDIRHGEECVVGDAHEKSEQQEGYVLLGEGGGHARDETEDIGGHDGWNPPVGVSQPAEENHAWDGSTEEEGLGEGRYPGLVAHPVLLHCDGDVVAVQLVLPACLALHHLPVSGERADVGGDV